MAKVVYASGIEYVQGSLSKPKKQEGHSHGDYLIGTHRTAPTENPNCTRIYIRKADTYVRTTQPSSNEMAARERFTVVSGMVKARAKDLSKLSADQAAFAAQKNNADGKKTMKAYYWMVCGAEYEAQQG